MILVMLAGGKVKSSLEDASIMPLSKSIKTYDFTLTSGAGGMGDALTVAMKKITISIDNLFVII